MFCHTFGLRWPQTACRSSCWARFSFEKKWFVTRYRCREFALNKCVPLNWLRVSMEPTCDSFNKSKGVHPRPGKNTPKPKTHQPFFFFPFFVRDLKENYEWERHRIVQRTNKYGTKCLNVREKLLSVLISSNAKLYSLGEKFVSSLFSNGFPISPNGYFFRRHFSPVLYGSGDERLAGAPTSVTSTACPTHSTTKRRRLITE